MPVIDNAIDSKRSTGIWFRISNPHHPALTRRAENMNRQKKLQQLFKAKAKKANAKLAPKKPKYISKADRLKMDAETAQDSTTPSES